MVKVKIDASQLKNELQVIYDQAVKAREATSDNKRRDEVNLLVEKIRTLRTEVGNI